MTTTTFSHPGAAHTAPTAVQAIREFLVSWFKATPVYVVYSALTK
ncbi:hypothetical protein [Azospirillum canadense]|nr:hypothetical protein [Azospirillum canadense]MCW2239577.1 hypothetical protein [Azospirillum canadense]